MNIITALLGKTPSLVRATIIFSRKHRVIATVYITVIASITLKMTVLVMRSPEQKSRDFRKHYGRIKRENP